MSTENDFSKAVKSANNVKEEWRKTTGNVRGDLLMRTANIIEERLYDIAETLTREMGKTLPEALGETARGVAILRYYAGEGLRSIGDVIPSTQQDTLQYSTRVPLGVVGVITPWNFPVAIPIWKMAPALIYGNTVVIKPASEAAITCAKIIDCFHEAGFPKGVVNMVTGSGSLIGQQMVEHPNIDGITFTGSNKVGKEIALESVKTGKKYQLEMGGNNPVIVANDADLDLAVKATISGGLSSTGQKCTATSRVIVESGIYDKFKDKLIEQVKELTVGDGLDSSSWMGPVISKSQLDTILYYIEKGKEEGAVAIQGGTKFEKENSNGYFVEPTIFENVTQNMVIAKEEIFGPVLALIKVDSVEEALNVANDSEYGLSASIFTENIKNMLSFIYNMEAGLIRVNEESAGVELQAPFGGMKQSSSHSREQGRAAIEFFTSIQTIMIK